ncbi:hypothetical protein CBW18_01500 [Pedobacter sp. AJM]|nr:hypothetical protein CBW18_01500 [Pedobacter sp. AJM]
MISLFVVYLAATSLKNLIQVMTSFGISLQTQNKGYTSLKELKSLFWITNRDFGNIKTKKASKIFEVFFVSRLSRFQIKI